MIDIQIHEPGRPAEIGSFKTIEAAIEALMDRMTEEQLQHWRTIGQGEAIRWPVIRYPFRSIVSNGHADGKADGPEKPVGYLTQGSGA